MTTGFASTPLATLQSFFRGQSIRWSTNFFDFDGNITEPPLANLIIEYSTPAATGQQITIPMTPPPVGKTTWTAVLDTRGMLAGSVDWSIETPGNAPVAVEDGTFILTANTANLLGAPQPPTPSAPPLVGWITRSSNYTASGGDRVLADTSGNRFTISLPFQPFVGTEVDINDAEGTWATNNLTVAGNGSNIGGSSSNFVGNINGLTLQFIFVGGAVGWQVFL